MLWQQYLRKLHKLFLLTHQSHISDSIRKILHRYQTIGAQDYSEDWQTNQGNSFVWNALLPYQKNEETLGTDIKWSLRHTVKWQIQGSKQSIEYTFCVRKNRKYTDTHTHTQLFLSKEILEEEATTSTKMVTYRNQS